MKEGQQNVPAWSAFNEFVSPPTCQVTTVKYLPFLRAPPTDLSTIYTALVNLVEFASNLGQSHIFVTADLAIYSKAQQILWSKPKSLEGRVTMRLGGMHITMAYIASIGKMYGDGGLLSVLIESDVYAEATARQLIQGKHLSLSPLRLCFASSGRQWHHG